MNHYEPIASRALQITVYVFGVGDAVMFIGLLASL
jgi:hypothetical protein